MPPSLYNALQECAYAAANYSDEELRFKVVDHFVHVLCSRCRIPGRVIAFRGATWTQRRLSRFKTSNFRFYGRLHRLNCSQHLVLLVEDEKRVSTLMFSMQKDTPCLEIIDVDNVAAIRFLIWLGSQLQKRLSLPVAFSSVWHEVVVPFCCRGTKSHPPSICHKPWRVDREKRTVTHKTRTDAPC